jgi:enoyl-CoA hydratase/carnithine racemase
MPHLDLAYPRPDIAVLTLNRPEKLNALNYELVEELHAALDSIAANNDCRVVVLTGAGRGFCSGLDLTDPNPSQAGGGTEFPRSGMRWQERIANLTARIHRLRQPVIAAVNGPAYGGGFGIVMACDIRLASASARFCTQFIKLGLGGCDIGVSYTLPRIIGAGAAFDLILTARVVDADEAAVGHRLAIVGIGGRRRAGHSRNALRLWQIRAGVDQASVVGEPRGVEPGGGAARGEPQPDPGVDQRGDARGG